MLTKKEYNPWSHIKSWIDPIEAEYWKLKIMQKAKWEQPLVSIYGSKYLVPRLTSFIGKKGITYRYSGINHIANGWPVWFIPLLNSVIQASQINFNGCLLNLYRNGNDRMGWHSDNEPELNPKMSIASLSLGSSRDFFFRENNTKNKRTLLLRSGDLLIMDPLCQRDWQHSVPIRKKVLDLRINLTFRSYI